MRNPRPRSSPERFIRAGHRETCLSRLIAVTLLLINTSPDAVHAQPPQPWLNGYAATLSGEVIGYRSAIPAAREALLVRSLEAESFIEWETAPVPADFSGRHVTFMWLAGYDSTADRRRWDLSINGEHSFTFSNEPVPEWSTPGPDGASLDFRLGMLDQHGDAQGFQFLTLPVERFVRGKPLRIRVTGESAGSRTWYMVFRHAPESTFEAASDPVVLRSDQGLTTQVHVDLTHIGPDTGARIEAPGAPAADVTLRLGFQRFVLPVPASTETERTTVSVRIGDDPVATREVLLEPVRDFEIWFLPHSHQDIGYTHVQEEVLELQWKNLEDAIDLAEATADYPEGSRYRWNVEGFWVTDEYLRRAPTSQRERFLDAVRQGWIGLEGLYGNQLTALAREEELFRTAGENVRELLARHQLRIRTAMIGDVPGYSWGMVPALAHNGIRYFAVGPNHIGSLPHGGDRVGYTLEAWGDRPFWWEDANGNDRVLFWMTRHGYSWFHGGNLGNLREENVSDVLAHLNELDEEGYPYDIVQLRYTIGGDNGPPDEAMPDFVRWWNETYERPKMRIATTEELFTEFERRYGDRLPVVRGELSPYWEDGAASSAFETALNRTTAERLIQAEALWALEGHDDPPLDSFRLAWKNVMLYTEHTWGAHNSISEPEIDFVRAQWQRKSAFATRAAALTDSLLAEALRLPADRATPVDAIEVLNTSSWRRSDLVLLPASWNLSGQRLIDDNGNAVTTQRLSGGELAFVAEDVPAMGSRVYRLDDKPSGPDMGSGDARPTGMDTQTFSLRLDPITGAVSSLLYRPSGRELVSADVHRGLNQYLYSGQNAADPKSNRGAEFKVLDNGPVVYTVRVRSNAPGARGLVLEFRLYSRLDRLDISNTLDKELVYPKENVRFAFPFDLPDAVCRVDAPWTTVRPDLDQMEGANKNYFTAHRYIDYAEADFGLTWVTLDAPLVELGGMLGEAWMSEPSRPWARSVSDPDRLYSWVMNNSWHTNYRAGQEGEVVFRYSLIPHGPYAAAEARRRSIERSQPLLIRPVDRDTRATSSRLLVDPAEDVLVTGLRPAMDTDAVIVRLHNASHDTQTVRLSGDLASDRLYRSDVMERRLERLEGAMLLGPGEIVTLRLE